MPFFVRHRSYSCVQNLNRPDANPEAFFQTIAIKAIGASKKPKKNHSHAERRVNWAHKAQIIPDRNKPKPAVALSSNLSIRLSRVRVSELISLSRFDCSLSKSEMRFLRRSTDDRSFCARRVAGKVRKMINRDRRNGFIVFGERFRIGSPHRRAQFRNLVEIKVSMDLSIWGGQA